MKKIKIAVLLLSVFALLSSSCKKSAATNPTPTQSISLKFNGTVKSSNVATADYIKSQQSLQIIGKFGGEGVSLLIENVKVGTFDVASSGALLTYSTISDFKDTYIADTGTVTITSFTSTTVSGTFQFSGTLPNTPSTGVITEGKFQVNLVTQ